MPLPHTGRRRDGLEPAGKASEAIFPAVDRAQCRGIDAHLLLEGGALSRVERAEHVFGRIEIVVARRVGDAHRPSSSRQARSDARLRCSQVLIVLTGRS